MEDTEVFTLDMKNYDRLVTRKNPWSILAMRESVGVKLHSRILRLDRSVPLLVSLQRKLDEDNVVKLKHQNAKESGQPLARGKTTLAQDFNDFIPQRGPLIDLFGPGTVFYRNRMRERAKREAKNKNRGFVSAGGAFPSWAIMGLKAPAPLGAATAVSSGSQINLDGVGGSPLPQIVQMACLLSSEASHSDGIKAPLRNAFITETDVNGKGPDDPLEPDWETSEARLSTLESRIKNWHTLVDKIGPSIVVTVDETDVAGLPLAPPIMPVEKRVVQLSRYKKDVSKKSKI